MCDGSILKTAIEAMTGKRSNLLQALNQEDGVMGGEAIPPDKLSQIEGCESCDDLSFLTLLNSPDPSVLLKVKVGDTLKLRLNGDPPIVEALTNHEKMVAGSITGYALVQLIACMRRGKNYDAFVITRRGGACEVLVRP